MLETYETEYTVTPGPLVKNMTIFVIVLCIVMDAVIPFSIYYYENDAFIALMVSGLITVIFIPLFIGAWAYSPQKYTTSEKGVRIVRPVGSILIPIGEITKVEDKQVSYFKTIRLWANGGLFSMSGKFYNEADGQFWMYAKNNNYVMLYAKTKWVVSPDDRELFITDIKSKIEKQRNR